MAEASEEDISDAEQLPAPSVKRVKLNNGQQSCIKKF